MTKKKLVIAILFNFITIFMVGICAWYIMVSTIEAIDKELKIREEISKPYIDYHKSR